MRHQWAFAVALGLAFGLTASAQAPDSLPGCTFNTTPPVLASGQSVGWQCDVNGKLITTLAAGSAVTSVATAGLATGGPITATGTVTVPASTQAEMEAAAVATSAVTPVVVKNHPGVAKAWAQCVNAAGVYTLASNYNIAGGTCGKTATGLLTLTFTIPFSSANYTCVPGTGSGGLIASLQTNLQTTTTVSIEVRAAAGANTDGNFSLVCFGDQ